MKTLSFFGAAGTVTGSSFMLNHTSKPSILVDMGMFQGPKHVSDLNYEQIGFDPSELSAVLLTHAHLDHCGRLPILMQHGFDKKIYMTQPTADLIELALVDAAHIAANDEDKEPMFSEEDVQKLLETIKIVKYDQEFELNKYLVTYRDAGHIMGSASIEVKDMHAQDGVEKIVFSGDIGNSPQDILKPAELIHSADVVLMESTYGGRTHPTTNPSDFIQDEINTIEKSGGTLLIPAFSIERTQELLHKLDHLKAKGAIEEKTPIFLDSPMAIRATKIYKNYRENYNQETAEHAQKDDPFSFPGLKQTLRSQESKEIDDVIGPKVIIAGSGMMTGGRIIKHAFKYLKRKTTRLLIVGYQGEETLGREIVEGADTVEIFDQEVEVNATVSNLSSMSSHADEPQLLEWLKNIKDVKKVFLVHGDDIPRADLSEAVKSKLNITNVVLPQRHDTHKVQ